MSAGWIDDVHRNDGDDRGNGAFFDRQGAARASICRDIDHLSASQRLVRGQQ